MDKPLISTCTSIVSLWITCVFNLPSANRPISHWVIIHNVQKQKTKKQLTIKSMNFKWLNVKKKEKLLDISIPISLKKSIIFNEHNMMKLGLNTRATNKQKKTKQNKNTNLKKQINFGSYWNLPHNQQKFPIKIDMHENLNGFNTFLLILQWLLEV